MDQHANAKPGDRVKMEATQLRKCWCVRPAGQLGTMGSYPVMWEAQFITAPSEAAALRKAAPYYHA